MKIKALLISALLILLLKSSASFSQSFTSTQNVWYYNYQSFYINGYVVVTPETDTTIENMLCKKFNFKTITNMYGTTKIDTSSRYGYFHEEDKKVSYFTNNQFYTLYDFNAKVGDSWKIYDPYCEDEEQPWTTTVIVDSLKKQLIDKDSLRMMYTHRKYYNDNSKDTVIVKESIIEGIGYSWWMFPTTLCIITEESRALRCFENKKENKFYKFSDEACDFIPYLTAVNEPEKNLPFSFSPNPFSTLLNITAKNNQHCQISLIDIYGRSLYKIQTELETYTVNTENLPPGSYLLKVELNGKLYTMPVIKYSE